MNDQKFDLSERLIAFAVVMVKTSEALPGTIAGMHLARQLIRSGTAPALQYGEAQGAESRSDFVHKMRVALKELRETHNCLRIIERAEWPLNVNLKTSLVENNQLVAIFVTSIKTASLNNKQNSTKTRK